LINWVKVLRPTRHKIGHFGDVPQANLLACYGKLNLTQQMHTFTIKRNVLQHKINTTSVYATWFTAGGAIRIAHYDVIDDVIT